MATHGPDGSLRSKEIFKFDGGGNWVKRATLKQVTRFGRTYLEPVTDEYRTIEYHR